MSKPIRVVHVLGGLDAGGAEAFVMNLYRAIDKDKVQFDFIKHVSKIGVFEEEIKSMGGNIFVCPKYKGINHIEYCRWWKNFWTQHPEYKIVHGHVRSTASIYLGIAQKYGIITIAHSHSTSNGSGVVSRIKDFFQLAIKDKADYMFACSDMAGEWLFGKNVLEKENYRMIPNGIDLKRYGFNAERRKQIRRELNIGDNEFVIGHVGRFTEPKNHRFLVELFYEYQKSNPNCKLLMIGNGELFAIIKERCEKLNIMDKVILPGSRIDIEDFYQAMDVFVFPSLWEGLGIVLIEAQANGLPCLVSKNIPKEAIVSRNVKTLSLNNMKLFLTALEEARKAGRNTQIEDKLLQYDIISISDRLEQLYLKLNEGC